MKFIFRRAALFSLLFLFLIFSGCSSSDSGARYSATIAEGRAAVQEVMAETGATSVSVALVDGNGVIWSEAFGAADREAALNATPATLYAACSVSKMLATMSVMILVDRGDVSLEEPVTTYIPAFSMPLDARYRDITVRMLLNHASGLPGNDSRGAVTVEPFPGYAAQMMDGLQYQRLKHNPGLFSAYNNDGFTMVANLVKAVTGQNYQDFVRENILTPLGMNSSRYHLAPLPDGSYARAYSGSTRLAQYYLNVYSSGGLFTTPAELSRLATLFINNSAYGSSRILSAKSIAAMAQDQRLGSFNPVSFDENRFGLGWDTVAQPGLSAAGFTAWQKTGDMSGFYGANIAVLPNEKLGVVVMGASNQFASKHAVKISERILLRALVESGRLAAMPAQLAATSLPAQTVTAEEKTTYAGFYAAGSGAYRLNFGADDTLSVYEYHSDWTPKYVNFRLRSDGWYAADDDPFTGLRLLTRGGYQYLALRLKRGMEHYTVALLFAQRFDNRAAISAAWQARLGEAWLPVNADPWYYLMMKGNSVFGLREITGVTGYLFGNKVLRDMTPPSDNRLDGMFLTLPDSATDLLEAGIESHNSENWLRVGSYLYRPLSGLPLLSSGVSTVTIGADGFAEWRSLPSSGSLSVNQAAYWFIYDDEFNELAAGIGSGTASFSGAGSKYLLLCGSAGTGITITLATP